MCIVYIHFLESSEMVNVNELQLSGYQEHCPLTDKKQQPKPVSPSTCFFFHYWNVENACFTVQRPTTYDRNVFVNSVHFTSSPLNFKQIGRHSLWKQSTNEKQKHQDKGKKIRTKKKKMKNWIEIKLKRYSFFFNCRKCIWIKWNIQNCRFHYCMLCINCNLVYVYWHIYSSLFTWRVFFTWTSINVRLALFSAAFFFSLCSLRTSIQKEMQMYHTIISFGIKK